MGNCRSNRLALASKVRRITLTAAVAAFALAADARGYTLTFDDLPSPNAIEATAKIPNGYGGFDWGSPSYMDPVRQYGTTGYSGYYFGMVSAPHVAFNAGQLPFTVSGAEFTFNSAYFAAAWNDGLTVEIAGYNKGTLIHNTSFLVNVTEPVYKEFNWVGVDQLVFSSAGGVWHGWGRGTHFVMDNMRINEVSEPSTVWLLAIGAGTVFAVRRRPWVS